MTEAKWQIATNQCIAEQQLNNIAKMYNGRWYRTETLNSRGERTTKFVVEFTTPESD